MQVMILEEDAVLRTKIAGALAPEGVDILAFGRLAAAKDAARRDPVDILVLGESVEGRLAHDVALLAEWRNPRLGSILLSDRGAEDADELFDLIPSLQAVLSRATGPRTLARVALATARSQEGIALPENDEAVLTDALPRWEDPDDAIPVGECDAELDRSAGVPMVPLAPAPLAAVAPEVAATPAASPGAAVLGLARQVCDTDHDVSALIREVLRQVEAEDEAALPHPPIVACFAASASAEPPSGRLYVLPNFLRDADSQDEDDPQDDESALLEASAASLLAARSAAPMRRLNLA